MIDRARLERWMQGREDEHCEFKRAENNLDSEDLADYCIALANEGSGHLILGVTDKVPRQVVGSRACQNLAKTKQTLLDRIHLRIEATEIDYDGKRVLVFSVPARPVGTPLQHNGRYLMRCGGSLTSMTPERLQAIFDERRPDFSALIAPGATLDDLDPAAIERFRALWHRKTGNDELLRLSHGRLLADAELIDFNGGVTQAALILLGTRTALGRHLPQAEFVFEYRSSDGSIPYQQRKEYRQGYLLFDDDLWNTISLRNEVQPVRDGMFIGQIRAFNEEVVREALLNAACHRDYRLGESVFVRQYPSRLEVESPGGLPDNITPETIIQRQFRRNRLIAEALQKCGLIERSSQGVDKMFRLMILESKPRPDYSGSDENRVLLRLYAEIQDPEFLNFIQKVGKQKKLTFDLWDLLLLDDIRQGKVRAADDPVRRLVRQGAIEKVGRGRGTRYILSKTYYAVAGHKGAYTRERGLDRETNKQLILKHLDHHDGKGTIQEFLDVLKELNRNQVHGLLDELREERRIRFVGSKRKGYWEKIEGG
jgi:ATP-dependent DNA helicase RecG